jgi:hypothetical protein
MRTILGDDKTVQVEPVHEDGLSGSMLHVSDLERWKVLKERFHRPDEGRPADPEDTPRGGP